MNTLTFLFCIATISMANGYSKIRVENKPLLSPFNGFNFLSAMLTDFNICYGQCWQDYQMTKTYRSLDRKVGLFPCLETCYRLYGIGNNNGFTFGPSI